ncbi:MAG TPA: sulfotransferase [Pyrinomonadaceae bacterium]|nr:sulfotransferase [Pyrinomonadaceae bacterium]
MSITDYFFVVGCPRSGTTLLSVLLDRHTRLCVPPETAFFDEVAPWLSHGDADSLLRILRRWRRLGELNLTPEAVLGRLGCGPSAPGQVLAAILDLYAQAHGKVRCGEKTPQHLMHVPTILQLFPDARIACLLRDGREAALSMNAMPWWPPQNLVTAATLWKRCAQLMERFTRQYPARFKVWRYEDLATRPEESLSSIMEYLDERFEPTQLRPDVRSNVVLPRSMEWKGRALQAIEAGHVGRRRHEATAEQIAFLERTLRDELHSHGYGSM